MRKTGQLNIPVFKGIECHIYKVLYPAFHICRCFLVKRFVGIEQGQLKINSRLPVMANNHARMIE